MAARFYYAPTQAEGKILYHGDNGEFQLLAVGHTTVAAVHLPSGWYFTYAAIAPNTWHFLAGVWKQGENLRLYLDGTLMDSVSVPNETLLDVGRNYQPSIGSYSRTVAYYFIGKIDDIRIYDRGSLALVKNISETKLGGRLIAFFNNSIFPPV